VEIVQVTPSNALPVSLSDARLQCSLLDDRHDDLLLSYILAAAAYVEGYTRARLATQTVRFTGGSFPVRLPIYPVQSITTVQYFDSDNASQTLTSADYYITVGGINPKITPVVSWPSVYTRPDAVSITAEVGFSSTPADIKAAVLMRVKEMFDRRGESVSGASLTPSAISIASLLGPHRMIPL